MSVLFVTESEIKTLTSIPNDVDSTLIAPYITIAQEMYVRTSLGDLLMNELVDQVSNSTLTALNTTLLDKIKPALAQFVFYEAIPFLAVRTTNKGLVFKGSDTSQNLSYSDVDKFRDTVRGLGEFYQQQYLNYLNNNKSSFPLYKDEDYLGNYGFNLNGLTFY